MASWEHRGPLLLPAFTLCPGGFTCSALLPTRLLLLEGSVCHQLWPLQLWAKSLPLGRHSGSASRLGTWGGVEPVLQEPCSSCDYRALGSEKPWAERPWARSWAVQNGARAGVRLNAEVTVLCNPGPWLPLSGPQFLICTLKGWYRSLRWGGRGGWRRERTPRRSRWKPRC